LGGSCLITQCAKHMLNGPCSWQLIYERLTNIGQTDKLKNINAPKDWSGCRGFVREDHRI